MTKREKGIKLANEIINIITNNMKELKDGIYISEFDFSEMIKIYSENMLILDMFVPILQHLVMCSCATTTFTNEENTVPLIILNSNLRKVLTDKEINFVIGHEIGHIKNKDLDGLGKNDLLVDENKEKLADKYSIENVENVEFKLTTIPRTAAFSLYYSTNNLMNNKFYAVYAGITACIEAMTKGFSRIIHTYKLYKSAK